jgi:Ni/Co efflux regulator RcnB
MRKLVYLSAAAMVLSPLVAAPAYAQQDQSQQQQQQQNARKALDPNQVVCEKQEETGSRLGGKRVCMTRSQWAEQRRLDRQEIDKAQVSVPMSAPQ